jgi:protein-tyrosine kinase
MPAPTYHSRAELPAMQDLISRIDASFGERRGRLIGFLASGQGEGTSTIALQYARAVSAQRSKRVLLIDASSHDPMPPIGGRGSLHGVLATLHAQQALSQGAEAPGEQTLWQLVPRTDLWVRLRQHFDEVVLDLPSTSASRDGLALAPYCDGVCVVIEAERTRAPVVEDLLASLQTVKARVLGAVMNRRRFHLPQRLYRLL